VSGGRSNDEVNAKVDGQLDTLQHVSTLFVTAPQRALAKKIASLTPAGSLPRRSLPIAAPRPTKTAILAAPCFTGNTEIVALRHSYHGRAATAMRLTGQGTWRLVLPQAGIMHAHNAYSIVARSVSPIPRPK
jgi:4-aminobutyrate aminotransferase-like enzyme